MDNSDIFRLFGRHSINICITYLSRWNQRINKSVYSGSIFLFNDTYLFLTAGHVLDEIHDLLNAEIYECIDCVIMDTIGHQLFPNIPIPISLKGLSFYSNVDDINGIDIGFFVINPHFVRLMLANSIAAIERGHISDVRKSDFDIIVLLGSPTNYVIQDGDGAYCIFEPVIVRIIPNKPHCENVSIDSLGRLSLSTDVYDLMKSIKGMSGGPIFGLRSDPEQSYYSFIGVISSEKPGSQKIFAMTSILAFSAIESGFDNATDNWKIF